MPNKCPFCQSDDVFVFECEDKSADYSFFWVECEACGARGPISEYKDGASQHWNAAPALSSGQRGNESHD